MVSECLNPWTLRSIEYAQKRSYLDDLYCVYLLQSEKSRNIDDSKWNRLEVSFEKRNNQELILAVLDLELSPIKDSYIAYLRRDRNAVHRNPRTVNRLCAMLYEQGLDEIYKRCSQPKETNRQIGPMFRYWLNRCSLGIQPVSLEQFASNEEDAILDAPDSLTKKFAAERLNYKRDKGLDFVARIRGKYIIGEAKFLTDFGGHQDAQLEDALSTLNSECDAITIAILDGVIYIDSNNKMHRTLYENPNKLIMSALVLNDFLYQV